MTVCRQWYFSLNNPRYWTKIDLNVVKLEIEKVVETLTQPRLSLLESLSVTIGKENKEVVRELLPKLMNLKHLCLEEEVSKINSK